MQAEASLRGNRLGSFRGSLAAAAEANPNRNLAKQTARKSMRMMNDPTTFNPGSTLSTIPMSTGGMKRMNKKMNNQMMRNMMN